MTDLELCTVFDKTLNVLTEFNSEDIIDIKAISSKYAKKIGGITGNSLAIPIKGAAFRWSQNLLVKQFANEYKSQVVSEFIKIPTLQAQEKLDFEASQALKIAQYDKKQAELKQIQEAQAARLASIVNICSENFISKVEKFDLAAVSQTSISFMRENIILNF